MGDDEEEGVEMIGQEKEQGSQSLGLARQQTAFSEHRQEFPCEIPVCTGLPEARRVCRGVLQEPCPTLALPKMESRASGLGSAKHQRQGTLSVFAMG